MARVKKVYVPSLVSAGSGVFSQANKLKYVDIGPCDIGMSFFSDCYSLRAIVFRNLDLKKPSLVSYGTPFGNCYHLTGTVNNSYNPNGDKDCYLYFPAKDIEEMKAKTNWTVYTDQMRILEEWTVDGTTTGEMDWERIGVSFDD